MKSNTEKTRVLTSYLILLFLVVVAIFVWFLNLVTQQRVFGVLLSAELVAFSMLIYVYKEPSEIEVNKSLLLLGELAVGILLILAIAVS